MSSVSEHFDVAVVGGGLSGLLVAREVLDRNPSVKVCVFEGQNRLGGRVQSTSDGIETGAAWIWTSNQLQMKGLVEELGLSLIRQDGGCRGQCRIKGGAHLVIEKLAETLENKKCSIRTGHSVRRIKRKDGIFDLTVASDDGSEKTFLASVAVVAAPPRVTLDKIQFDPVLPESKLEAMRDTPTWMSKVSKVVFTFDEAWWKKSKTNVNGSPRLPGPAFQVYDASSMDEKKVYAITAFCQAGASTSDDELESQVAHQLGRWWLPSEKGDTFLKKAKTVSTERWCLNSLVNEDPRDLNMFHPSPKPELSRPLHDGQLLFAGSEAAPEWSGFMEGAVASAKIAAKDVLSAITKKDEAMKRLRDEGQTWVEINSNKHADILVNLEDVDPTKAAGRNAVTRHMYERLGGEVARATTKVTFEPNASFPEHEHTGGEEFVVLNGVWRDRWGSFPKFSYVRNYIGSRHSPEIGPEGVEIMVKLRQMTTEHVEPENSSVNFAPPKDGDETWTEQSAGVRRKELFKSPFETVYAEFFEPNAVVEDTVPEGSQEILVVDGSYADSLGDHKLHSWARYGKDGQERTRIAGDEGALLYVKEGHREMPEVGVPPLKKARKN